VDWSADPGLGLVMMPDVDRSSTAKASQPAKVKAKSQGKSQIQSKSRPRLTDRSKVVQLAGTGRKDHLAATIPSERCLCGAFSSLGLGQRNSYLGSGVQVQPGHGEFKSQNIVNLRCLTFVRFSAGSPQPQRRISRNK